MIDIGLTTPSIYYIHFISRDSGAEFGLGTTTYLPANFNGIVFTIFNESKLTSNTSFSNTTSSHSTLACPVVGLVLFVTLIGFRIRHNDLKPLFL
jgi:hypothetical protein